MAAASLSLMLANPLTAIRHFATSSEGHTGNTMIHPRQWYYWWMWNRSVLRVTNQHELKLARPFDPEWVHVGLAWHWVFIYPSPLSEFGGRSTYWYSGHQLTWALLTVWSSRATSLMWNTLSSFWELEGRPDFVSSSTNTLPDMNRLCHSNTRFITIGIM
jgi:hypothetical protein